MLRSALSALLAIILAATPVLAEGDATRPPVVVTVACSDLTAAARARHTECTTQVLPRQPTRARSLFLPFRLAERRERPPQRRIFRLPWVIGAYQ